MTFRAFSLNSEVMGAGGLRGEQLAFMAIIAEPGALFLQQGLIGAGM